MIALPSASVFPSIKQSYVKADPLSRTKVKVRIVSVAYSERHEDASLWNERAVSSSEGFWIQSGVWQ